MNRAAMSLLALALLPPLAAVHSAWAGLQRSAG